MMTFSWTRHNISHHLYPLPQLKQRINDKKMIKLKWPKHCVVSHHHFVVDVAVTWSGWAVVVYVAVTVLNDDDGEPMAVSALADSLESMFGFLFPFTFFFLWKNSSDHYILRCWHYVGEWKTEGDSKMDRCLQRYTNCCRRRDCWGCSFWWWRIRFNFWSWVTLMC